MTLPGVDMAVAEAVLAALGDVTRFKDADQAASYLGLVPKTKSSANRCYHGSITKAGNSQARWMLVQAAQQLGRHPGPLGHFFRKLTKKKNRNVAVVAVARKLATIAWHLLTKNEPYRYAVSRNTQVKLSRLRIKATGKRRKTGPKQGFGRAKLQAGVKSYTIKPLSQVYDEEGIPSLSPPTMAEERAILESGAAEYVQSLEKAQIMPVKRKTKSQRQEERPLAARSTGPSSLPGDEGSKDARR